jgi:hypothetical protein
MISIKQNVWALLSVRASAFERHQPFPPILHQAHIVLSPAVLLLQIFNYKLNF